MPIAGISRIAAGFLLAPLIGISTANILSFVLWAWRAPGIEVLSSMGILQMYAYVLAAIAAALVMARRWALWSVLTWLTIGAISGIPACIRDIWFWSEASGAGLVNAEFVFRYLALYLFAGAVAGGTFWLFAVVGNRTLTRRSTRTPAGGASPPRGGAG
jgi:hypothetical protein